MRSEGLKRQQTRFRIKKVGAKHFFEKGFKDTMINDIAHEVGLDRRTIYRYFASKELLLIEICSDYLNEFVKVLRDANYSDSWSGYQKIEHMFETYFDYLKESPDMMLFLGMIDASVGKYFYNVEEYVKLNRYGKQMDDVLALFIKEGQEDGSVNMKFEPQEYATTINNSIVALATRISIYLPNVLIQAEGTAWKLLLNQGKLLIESMETQK